MAANDCNAQPDFLNNVITDGFDETLKFNQAEKKSMANEIVFDWLVR